METGAAPCARRVCRLRDGGMRGYEGGRRTPTSAKVPVGSIATPRGPENLALAPVPSRKPRVPMPARVVVAPVAMLTRRIRRVCRLRNGGMRGRPTHPDEREGAAWVDRDATRVVEEGAGAGAIEEVTLAIASRTAAGEGGGRPGGDFDTADAVVRPHCGGNRCGPYAVCEVGVPSAGWRDAGVRGRATHADEREGAAWVDRDAIRAFKLGAAAVAVEEAQGAAAGEGGGFPGGDIDTADALVLTVLRCIMKGHAERGASQRSAAAGTTSH
eukprot:scaffold20089_cov59-Phaeocystis_antarctica.AAC.3